MIVWYRVRASPYKGMIRKLWNLKLKPQFLIWRFSREIMIK